MPRKSWDLGSACSKTGTSSSESHYDSHSRQSWRRMPDQGEGRGNTMKVKHRPGLAASAIKCCLLLPKCGWCDRHVTSAMPSRFRFRSITASTRLCEPHWRSLTWLAPPQSSCDCGMMRSCTYRNRPAAWKGGRGAATSRVLADLPLLRHLLGLRLWAPAPQQARAVGWGTAHRAFILRDLPAVPAAPCLAPFWTTLRAPIPPHSGIAPHGGRCP